MGERTAMPPISGASLFFYLSTVDSSFSLSALAHLGRFSSDRSCAPAWAFSLPACFYLRIVLCKQLCPTIDREPVETVFQLLPHISKGPLLSQFLVGRIASLQYLVRHECQQIQVVEYCRKR